MPSFGGKSEVDDKGLGGVPVIWPRDQDDASVSTDEGSSASRSQTCYIFKPRRFYSGPIEQPSTFRYLLR